MNARKQNKYKNKIKKVKRTYAYGEKIWNNRLLKKQYSLEEKFKTLSFIEEKKNQLINNRDKFEQIYSKHGRYLDFFNYMKKNLSLIRNNIFKNKKIDKYLNKDDYFIERKFILDHINKDWRWIILSWSKLLLYEKQSYYKLFFTNFDVFQKILMKKRIINMQKQVENKFRKFKGPKIFESYLMFLFYKHLKKRQKRRKKRGRNFNFVPNTYNIIYQLQRSLNFYSQFFREYPKNLKEKTIFLSWKKDLVDVERTSIKIKFIKNMQKNKAFWAVNPKSVIKILFNRYLVYQTNVLKGYLEKSKKKVNKKKVNKKKDVFKEKILNNAEYYDKKIFNKDLDCFNYNNYEYKSSNIKIKKFNFFTLLSDIFLLNIKSVFEIKHRFWLDRFQTWFYFSNKYLWWMWKGRYLRYLKGARRIKKRKYKFIQNSEHIL